MENLEHWPSASRSCAQDDALRLWAVGSLPLMAGVEMLLGSTVKGALWPVLVCQGASGPWLDTEEGHHATHNPECLAKFS